MFVAGAAGAAVRRGRLSHSPVRSRSGCVRFVAAEVQPKRAQSLYTYSKAYSSPMRTLHYEGCCAAYLDCNGREVHHSSIHLAETCERRAVAMPRTHAEPLRYVHCSAPPSPMRQVLWKPPVA
jgi:hypothetical protein